MARKGKNSKTNRQERREAHQRSQRKRWLRVGGLILLAVVALGTFSFFKTSTAPQVDEPEEIMASNVLGSPAAPVHIVEFGDFGCPACRQWHNSGIKDQLLVEFGDQITFTFRHFPVITSQSPRAAEAGQCASEQGHFWPYHDFIYESTPLGTLSVDELKSYAAAVGLEEDQFNRCIDSGRFKIYVARDQSAAVAAGARGTPTFFINGQIVDFYYESMASAIRHELES